MKLSKMFNVQIAPLLCDPCLLDGPNNLPNNASLQTVELLK